MAGFLKQSTAAEVPIGPFVDATDGVTAETGLTISQADVRLKKEGGDWAQKNESTAAAHEENGNYRCLLDTTDTNTLGRLRLHVAESGALPVWEEYTVLAANIYDSLVGGGDLLDVSVTQWLGTAAATPTVAGVPEVDLTHMGGVAQSAADLKDFADDGYDPSTNKVQGVVLVDTLTTYTGNTPQTGDAFARIGSAGAGLTAVPWNASWDAEVQSEVADALDAAIPGSPTANSINERIQTMDNAYTATRAGYLDNLNGHVAQSGDAYARLGAPAGASIAADLAAVKVETAAILDDTGTSGVVVAAGSKSGYALSSAGVTAIWADLTSGMSTAGSIGKRLVDYLTGDIFARLGAPAGASTAADIAAIKTETAAILDDTGTSGVVVASGSKTGYALSSTGLDSVAMAESTSAPTAGSTFIAKIAWVVQRFLRSDMTASVLTTKTIAGATVSTQALTDNGTTQTVGPPT